MARRLDAPPNWRKAPRFAPGHGARYPWESWMDGNPWEIVKGDDYTCSTASMAHQMRRRGKDARMKLKAETYTNEDPQRIVFQFFTPGQTVTAV